jgi:pimeloyl-ACP methyl ester carboxylesterase
MHRMIYGGFSRVVTLDRGRSSSARLNEEHEVTPKNTICLWYDGGAIEAARFSLANDASAREWWARFQRQASSPGAAVAVSRMDYEIDVRPILSAIRVPPLIPAPHRRSHGASRARTLSRRHVPGARYVELPGTDHFFFTGHP